MSATKQTAFVFVTCGSDEYINSLNFSIKALKRITQHPIFVVTDSKRNNKSIEHDTIIDVTVPKHYSNHQASIWLKTSLPNFLPKGFLYAYLDSDVIALSSKANNIFNFYKPPITFAHDHTTLSFFSPYAVNCLCNEKFLADKNNFESAVKKVIQHNNFPGDYYNPFYRILLRSFSATLSFKLLIYLYFGLCRTIKISNDIVLDIKNKEWVVKQSYRHPVLFLHRKSLKKSGYTFSLIQNQWIKTDEKRYLQQNRCNHLHEAMLKKFGIKVPANFHHWNGGVFLFDEQSFDFMQQWHKNTLSIFADSYWKVRDQASLIVTVFQKGLHHHPTLPENFNFIADFYRPEIYPHPVLTHAFYKNRTIVEPYFIHVYHQWQNTSWDVWNRIIEILNLPPT